MNRIKCHVGVVRNSAKFGSGTGEYQFGTTGRAIGPLEHARERTLFAESILCKQVQNALMAVGHVDNGRPAAEMMKSGCNNAPGGILITCHDRTT